MRNVILPSERLELYSPLGKVNSNTTYSYMSNGNTAKYMDAAPYPYTLAHAESFLKFLERVEDSDSMIELGIFLKSNDKFIGMVSLENIDYNVQKCEIGYWVATEFTGYGYAKEACNLVINYAFSELKINKIAAYVIKEHTSSIALLNQLGFCVEGLLKYDVKNKGKFADRYVMALFNSLTQNL